MNQEFKDAFAKIQAAQNEAEVRDALHSALKAVGSKEWHLERSIPTGSVDMLSYWYRTIIETKARGKCNPLSPGSLPLESQRDQIIRYLYNLTKKELENSIFEKSKSVPWRGFLTDGLHWWGFDKSPEGITTHLKDSRGTQCNSADSLWNYLLNTVAPASRENLPPPPDDLTEEIFIPYLDDVLSLISQIENKPAHRSKYETKFGIWQFALQGAGIVPSENQPLNRIELFARHTLLVVSARILKLVLRGWKDDEEAVLSAINDGFPAWLCEFDQGRTLVVEVAKRLSNFDWSGETRDRLKEAYHALIPKEVRKEFGEYYTPDWLAIEVVEETLDDAWIDKCIIAASKLETENLHPSQSKVGIGVLDPACGSGTFLFHAARRIRKRIQQNHPALAHNTRQILIRLVTGIDVHPVAAEMAQATLEMALPAMPTSVNSEPQVYLGDSMQSKREDYQELTDKGQAINILSPAGTNFPIPREVLLHPRANELIERLNDDANKDSDSPYPELSEEGQRITAIARHTLTDIIRQEANHVWGWHLRNLAGPIRLSENKVGRIVTNPPWLVSNDTPDGDRKETIKNLQKKYSLKAKLAGSSARGDLASVFSARVADLYLSEHGRMGLVLPGSALISHTWEPWRSGKWGAINISFKNGWGLDEINPPVFKNVPNGTCAIFVRRTPKAKNMNWNQIGWWYGDYNDPEVRIKPQYPQEQSVYFSEFKMGALSKPYCLLMVPKENSISIDDYSCKITTKMSTKPPWKGHFEEAVVERISLIEIATSKALKPFQISGNMFLLVPLVATKENDLVIADLDNEEFEIQLPLLYKYWEKVESFFQEHRAGSAGATLSRNLDFNATLSKQLKLGLNMKGGQKLKFVQRQLPSDRFSTKQSAELKKVFYNKSGGAKATLRAARNSAKLIAGETLYWFMAESESEAAYLCGVINAPCMQIVWRASKSAPLHFDKNPWRLVPVPKYDNNDILHENIASLAKSAELDYSDDIARDLDRAVSSLLPQYADSS